MSERATHWKAQANALLDVRPELEQGGEPFVRIMEAAFAVKSGGTLVIVAPFEPVPLYAVLEGHHPECCVRIQRAFPNRVA